MLRPAYHDAVPGLPPFLIAAVLGLLLAGCGLPLPWSLLTPIPLAVLFAFVATAETPRQVASRMGWAGTAYCAVQLWWLAAFLAKLFGNPVLGAVSVVLFALEGAFFAGMAYLVAACFRSRIARVWGLAGGWVLLEWLRFLGPLAFPWPTLGYTLLPTPAIQIADLGGVLLGSVLVVATAAALVSLRWDSPRPYVALTLTWLAVLLYGVTRSPGQGPVGSFLVIRTTIDQFSGEDPDELFQASQRLTRRDRQPGEVPVWSESALRDPALLTQTSSPGLYGLSLASPRRNTVTAWSGTEITSQTDKARPVPFGEYFPFHDTAPALYRWLEQRLGFNLGPNLSPARRITALTLQGVQYGAYVCYDSVFPWVARTLAQQGATLLVNPSNDGWYEGWGVQQHFSMGRVRAIETRRWLIRSVNEGMAGAVDDLGRPRQLLSRGEGTVHVRPRLLSGQTLYLRLGDLPAVLLAILMLGSACWKEKRGRRERISGR